MVSKCPIATGGESEERRECLRDVKVCVQEYENRLNVSLTQTVCEWTTQARVLAGGESM